MSVTNNHLKKILRLKHLKEKLGLSTATIYNKLNPRSKYFDATFVRPIRLSANAVGWIEADVDAWLDNCKQAGRSP